MTGRPEIWSVWVLKVEKRVAEVGATEEQVEVFPISLHCALSPIVMSGWDLEDGNGGRRDGISGFGVPFDGAGDFLGACLRQQFGAYSRGKWVLVGQ